MPELERTKDVGEDEPSSSYNTAPPGTVKPRPKKNTISDQEVIQKLQELCIISDPLLIYSNMDKIGQG